MHLEQKLVGKKYRFFYHYYKGKKMMSVHFRKVCYPIQDVICNVPCETKWNTTQPQLVMRGYCSDVSIIKGKAVIS